MVLSGFLNLSVHPRARATRVDLYEHHFTAARTSIRYAVEVGHLQWHCGQAEIACEPLAFPCKPCMLRFLARAVAPWTNVYENRTLLVDVKSTVHQGHKNQPHRLGWVTPTLTKNTSSIQLQSSSMSQGYTHQTFTNEEGRQPREGRQGHRAWHQGLQHQGALIGRPAPPTHETDSNTLSIQHIVA